MQTAGGPTESIWKRLVELSAFGGWTYRDAHYLVVDVEIDPDRAKKFLPKPLRLARPARAQIFTAYFPETTFGSVYHEAGIFFEVVHRFRRAIHCPWMLVDDDVALILGRELLGYPKKLGEIDWQLDGDRVRAVVRRRGAELLTMTAKLGAPEPSAPPMLARPHRNIRSSLGIAVPKVIAFKPRERVREVRRAEVELHVAGSERDPLERMGFGRVLGGRLHRVDLGGGTPPIPVGTANPVSFARQLLIRSY
jgi:acetoacetate decarboxylase